MTNTPQASHQAKRALRAVLRNVLVAIWNLVVAVWDALGSLEVAAVVLLVFTAGTLLGTFIPQGEAPQQYVAAYGGTRARILQSLQLTNLYFSAWYRFLIGLLTASVLVCTVRRYKSTVARARVDDGEFTQDRVWSMRASRGIEAGSGVGGASERIVHALRRIRYRARMSVYQDRICIAADKGRIGNWGMFVLHTSLLIIVIGALIGAKLGFTGYTMWVAEGESSSECARSDYSQMVYADDPHNPGHQIGQRRIVQKRLPFSIFLEDFRVGVSKEGNPTAYESKVRVMDRDKVAKRFKITTNRPLSYRGTKFYQNDFSVAAVTIRITGPDSSETLTTWPVRQEPGGPGGRTYVVMPTRDAIIETADGSMFLIPAGFAPNYDPNVPWELPTRGDLPANPAVLVYVHPAMGHETGMRMPEEVGWVSSGQPQEHAGYIFSLVGAQLESALGVGRNPGLPVVYVGFGTLVLGLVLAFYVRHRIVRVCLQEENGRTMAALGGTERLGDANFDREFEAVEKAASAKEGV